MVVNAGKIELSLDLGKYQVTFPTGSGEFMVKTVESVKVANDWLLTMSESYKSGSLAHGLNAAKKDVKDVVALELATDNLSKDGSSSGALSEVLTKQQGDQKPENVTSSFLNAASMAASKPKKSELPESSVSVHKGSLNTFLQLAAKDSCIKGVMFGKEAWNKKFHAVCIILTTGSMEDILKEKRVQGRCSALGLTACGALVVGSQKHWHEQSQAVLDTFSGGCADPLLICADLTDSIAGVLCAWEQNHESNQLIHVQISHTTQPRDQKQRLTYTMVHVDEFGVSHIEHATKKVCAAVIEHALARKRSQDQSSNGSKMASFRRIEVPADGLCGFHSLCAINNLDSFEQIPRKQTGCPLNNNMLATEIARAKRLHQYVCECALERCSDIGIDSIDIERLQSNPAFAPTDLKWISKTLGYTVRLTCAPEVDDENDDGHTPVESAEQSEQPNQPAEQTMAEAEDCAGQESSVHTTSWQAEAAAQPSTEQATSITPAIAQATPTEAPQSLQSPPEAPHLEQQKRGKKRKADSPEVLCIQLTEKVWNALKSKDTEHLVKGYHMQPTPTTVYVLVSSNDNAHCSCIYVGTISVLASEQITFKKDLKTYMSDTLEEQAWRGKINAGHKAFAWQIGNVKPTPQGHNVKFVGQKFRSRHFRISKAKLFNGIDISIPKPSLFRTSGFFLKLLSNTAYDKLRKVANALDGHCLRIGTSCSGSDICMVAATALIQELGTEFGAYNILDSQNFLVRHRRNRVYGVAAVNTGSQSESEYQLAMSSILSSLQTHCSFSMEETFDTTLPQQFIQNKRERDHVDRILELVLVNLPPPQNAVAHPAPPVRLRGKQPAPAYPAAKSTRKRKGTGKVKQIRGKGGKGNSQAKGKKAMATIWQKEQICKAWDEIKASGVKNPSKVLEGRKLPGFFTGCVYESKWGAQRVSQQWSLVCAAAPQLCKKHKELPNSLRTIMQLPEKNNNLPHGAADDACSKTLPFPLKCVVESLIMEKIQCGQEVTMCFVKNAIAFCCDLWNECVHTIRGNVQEKSLSMLQRICGLFGISNKSNEKPGAHLPFDHPQLQAVRVHIRKLAAEGQVHDQLIMNFDQVWSTNFRPTKRSLQKRASLKGETKDPHVRSMMMRRIRHNIERFLDLPFTEADPDQKILQPDLRPPTVLGGEAASGMIEAWRVPRSVTTLSFVDGYIGRSFVTVRSGTLRDEAKAIEAMQRTRGSMREVLELAEIPEIDEDDPELDHMHEEKKHWALQPIEADPGESYLFLPAWMSRELEMKICVYVDEHAGWKEKIEKRAALGKDLTSTQQTRYDEWLCRCEPRLVFSKTRRCLVRDAKQVKADCVAIKLCLSEDPEKLQVVTTSGDVYRLVLLTTVILQELEGAVPAEVVAELETSEEEDDFVDADEEGPTHEMDAIQMETEKHLAEQCTEMSGETCDVYVACDSDEGLSDYELEKQVPKGVTVGKIKSFSFRPAYKKMESLGLVDLPRHITGCSISYHASSRQWQGLYPGCSHGLTSVWGGASLRSEEEAILKVVRSVVSAHLEKYPKDKLWQKQLEKLKEAEAKGFQKS
eukprot:Skav228403  [mRNA]  locus=scaffold3824:14733:31266:- [translate_table: standard]